MEYSAVGETTHLAARMEQLATPGTVLATQTVARLAGDYLQLNALGPVPVRGRSEPVEVFEVVGTTATRTRSAGGGGEGSDSVRRPPGELQSLGNLLRRAGSGAGQVAALVGEPGVGKSRLCWELCHVPQTRGFLILEGDSVSYGREHALSPDRRAAARLLPDRGRRHRAQAAREDRGEAARPGRSLDGDRCRFCSRCSRAGARIATAGVDAQQRAWRTQDALKRLLLRQSQVQPLLLIFENLHWVDGETQLFLDTLVESVPAAAILVLVTYRPEYQHKWAAKAHYTQLLIDALPAESAGALVRAVLAEQPGVEELARLLVERTGGNPLFLEESIKTLVETKVLVGEQRAYRLAKPLNAIEVPATVQAVLAARIDRHAPDEKRLLQSAAVIGKQAPLSLLQAVAVFPEQVLRKSHRAPAGRGVPVRDFALPRAPVHVQAQPHLRSGVCQPAARAPARPARADRGSGGGAAGGVQGGAGGVSRLPRLPGPLWQKAVRYLRQAGAKALTRAANREAVAHFQKALEASRAGCRRAAQRWSRPSICASTWWFPTCSSGSCRRSSRCCGKPRAWPRSSPTSSGWRAPSATW